MSNANLFTQTARLAEQMREAMGAPGGHRAGQGHHHG